MPSQLDDPTAPVIYRTSGPPPYPTASDPQIPPTITPRQVTLRDRITIASLIPFSSVDEVPHALLDYLCSQLNREIEKGDTYPMISEMPLSTFGPYWFQNFAAVMILGEVNSVEQIHDLENTGIDWAEVCLGSFYVKPNYPGRSSHVCNGGFLVTEAARNRGVGRLMGEGYLEWAPKLGYTYSVFNLVYETNVASCRIWDALGFKRVGRIKGCGNLRSYPDEFVDAIIYGRDLGPEGEDFVSEERFDKIRFYLKHGKYPGGADRAEKSRLRSAATHYKLLPIEDGSESGERLMLKDKEVVSDPQRQYEIARQVHAAQHAGINKTTATIAEKYHWVRIKETVSLAIKNCPDCKESIRPASMMRSVGDNQASAAGGGGGGGGGAQLRSGRDNGASSANNTQDPNALIERLVDFTDLQSPSGSTDHLHHSLDMQTHHHHHHHPQSMASMGDMHQSLSSSPPSHSPFDALPVDPQIMHSHNGQQHAPHPQTSSSSSSNHHHHPHLHHPHHHPQHQHHQQHQSFEDQLCQATHPDPGGFGLYDHLASSPPPHPSHHLHSHSHSPPHHQQHHHFQQQQQDTRLATDRHVRERDEPMAFVDETAGGEGAFEMEAKAMEGLGPEEEEECLVDFEGRGV